MREAPTHRVKPKTGFIRDSSELITNKGLVPIQDMHMYFGAMNQWLLGTKAHVLPKRLGHVPGESIFPILRPDLTLLTCCDCAALILLNI
jgi:hypothetical protein